jgi:hypothetical protein
MAEGGNAGGSVAPDLRESGRSLNFNDLLERRCEHACGGVGVTFEAEAAGQSDSPEKSVGFEIERVGRDFVGGLPVGSLTVDGEFLLSWPERVCRDQDSDRVACFGRGVHDAKDDRMGIRNFTDVLPEMSLGRDIGGE